MAEVPQTRKVQVSFVGAPPAKQVARASGVSSFQPFLEALHGHGVVSLESTTDLIQEG